MGPSLEFLFLVVVVLRLCPGWFTVDVGCFVLWVCFSAVCFVCNWYASDPYCALPLVNLLSVDFCFVA